jgi:hypothetical protein
MFYKPECIDDFYKDLHRIRAELTSIQSGEKNWITSTQVQLASAKLAICLKDSVFGFEKPSFSVARGIAAWTQARHDRPLQCRP